jgi:hypothetical protein
VELPDSGDLVPGLAPLASVVVPALGYTVAGPRASTRLRAAAGHGAGAADQDDRTAA